MMKRLFFTFALALIASATTFALDNIVLDNFEADSVGFTSEVHVNPDASMDIAVVNNPVKAGINTSNKVWEWKRYDMSPGTNQSWAGFWAILKKEVPSGYHRIEVKYLRKNATSQLRIKCEGAITKEFNPVAPATKVNEWETMVFDLTANGIKNITVLGLFPDYYEPVDPNSICYIDDITVVFDPTINPPPAPTMLTLFDNSTNNRFHDQSWVNQTLPSVVLAENWEAPNMANGDKLPCDTVTVKAGKNAIKLQWKSVDTGAWMAMVASVGWKPFDLTTMTNFKFWVNSPVTLAKSALPKFYFEAFAGNPNKTGKLLMADYVKADLVANTWTEIDVPVAAILAADPLFTAKDVIKGIFFEQNASDNAQHTMYLDEFTFVNKNAGPAPLTLFDNSANNRFHDQSWVNQSMPSTVVAENWEAPNMANGDKLPCVTSPVKAGANALKLQWKSAVGGDWMALVAAVGWTSFDVTGMTHLSFWVNSPVALAKSVLPKVNFEAFSGNPNATGKIELSNYLHADLPANTWVQVRVPLADIWATNAAFTSQKVIKGLFFSQSATDNVEHTLYVDEMSFIFDNTPPPAPMSFFSNSANNRFHDQSWINQTMPSTVVAENWEAPNMANGDKLPCVTSPVKSGANALKLQWKSAVSGDWMAMVAAVGWTSFDVTGMTHLSMWVNSPVTLAKAVLPKLNFEAFSGNPNATGKIEMANYVTTDIPANTWVEVRVPLADFWAANPLFASQGVIKGLFFSQNATDNVEHTLYVDEMSFVYGLGNGITPTFADRAIKTYYANGELFLLNYSGDVRLFDIAGKMITRRNTNTDNLRIPLKAGVYIVFTARGNAKIVVR